MSSEKSLSKIFDTPERQALIKLPALQLSKETSYRVHAPQLTTVEPPTSSSQSVHLSHNSQAAGYFPQNDQRPATSGSDYSSNSQHAGNSHWQRPCLPRLSFSDTAWSREHISMRENSRFQASPATSISTGFPVASSVSSSKRAASPAEIGQDNSFWPQRTSTRNVSRIPEYVERPTATTQRPQISMTSQGSPRLHIRQHPEAARACGLGERDRRVIDPPPILELGPASDPAIAIDEDRPSATYIVHASLWNEDQSVDLTTCQNGPRSKVQRLVGSLVASATSATDEYNHRGAFFTFADLSCRETGRFRLRFTLLRIDPQNVKVGAAVPIVNSIFSNIFTVYLAKDFPGMQRSTPLMQALKIQGVSIPAKKGRYKPFRKREAEGIEPTSYMSEGDSRKRRKWAHSSDDMAGSVPLFRAVDSAITRPIIPRQHNFDITLPLPTDCRQLPPTSTSIVAE